MDQGLIPHRYAKALYMFALEKGQAERVYSLMKALTDAMSAEPQLDHVMANPYVSVADKTRLMTTAARADAESDACFADFIKLLIRNKRIEFMRPIALDYLDIYRKANNIHLVAITTAAELPEPEILKLHSVVERHLGGATVEYTHRVDPALIGGFIINVNSERLDASISNELKQLRLKLLSN